MKNIEHRDRDINECLVHVLNKYIKYKTKFLQYEVKYSYKQYYSNINLICEYVNKLIKF